MNKRANSNTIRIIAGQWRGRRIPVLHSHGLRPTTDRVRERLFSWLMYDLAGSSCLDLFAGTGALGLECLSRGASAVQFVESSHSVAASLKKNIAQLNAEEQLVSVAVQEARHFLSRSATQQFDIVFLDPPFASGLLAETVGLLTRYGWLADGALIYIEQPKKADMIAIPKLWQLHREGSTGQSHYALYINKTNSG